MKLLIFLSYLFKRFPSLLTVNLLVYAAVGVMEMTGVLFLAPLVDLFLHPNLEGLSPLTLKFLGYLTLAGIESSKRHVLTVFLAVITVQSSFIILAGYVNLKAKYAILKSILMETFTNFFKARWAFFTGGSQGTMLNTFNRELNVLGDSLGFLGAFCQDTFRLLFYCAVPLYISWQGTALVMAAGLIFATPLLFLGRLSYTLGQRNTSTANRMMEVLQESLGGAKLILGFGNQEKSVAALDHAFDQHRRASIKSQMIGIAVPKIYEPFGWLTILASLYIFVEYLDTPIAEVAVFGYAMLRIVPILGNILRQKNVLVNFYPSFEQIASLNSQALLMLQETGATAFTSLRRHIELRGVTFAYPGHEPVLRNVHATVERAGMTAFVGNSGSGKTTLTDIVMGFYTPDEGVVLVDKTPLPSYNIQSYRKRVGFVPQDSVLFNDTIAYNLLWGREDATTEDMVEACKLANAHDFIMALPKGYDTQAGDRGVLLSGGQRQRIALARALIRTPELLILDEATSNLDSQSELLIKESIERVAGRITVIVIAHRLSTIVGADRIYVLENGVIVEEGTYTGLISRKGVFYRMARLQGLVDSPDNCA